MRGKMARLLSSSNLLASCAFTPNVSVIFCAKCCMYLLVRCERDEDREVEGEEKNLGGGDKKNNRSEHYLHEVRDLAWCDRAIPSQVLFQEILQVLNVSSLE